jgi:hypothetical protein
MKEITRNSEADNSVLREQIIAGIWKFKHEVPVSELEAVAKEWATNPKFTSLFIRKVSKDQYGICFMYDDRDAEDNEPSYDAFFDSTTDQLKKKFGNSLCGWDVSSTIIPIK